MTSTTLVAPVDRSAPVRTGPRVYRKQVLKRGRINYPLPGGGTRTVEFDDAYLTDLANAYRDGAYDQVPFQLADAENRHNEDPTRYGGRVLGAEVTPDGLDLMVELAEDTAQLVEKTGRTLGVSARIKEQLEHVDGRKFPRAIRHVLGTLNPRVQGLAPWQPIDLAADEGGVVVDLSAYTYEGDAPMTRPILDLSQLDDDARDQLVSFAAAADIDLSVALVDSADEVDTDEHDELEDEDVSSVEDDEPFTATGLGADDGDDLPPLSDEDLDALLEQEVAAILGTTDEGVQLSDDDEGTYDLAGADEHRNAATVARQAAAAATYDLAVERYTAAGVPPFVLDLARPVLELPADADAADGLDLASPVTGEAIDVRGIVTGLLDAMRGHVDLAAESGHGHHDPSAEHTQTVADGWTDYLQNN